jgi:hypothetical protein
MVLVPTPTELVVTSYNCLRRDDGLKESKAIGGVIRTSEVRVSAFARILMCRETGWPSDGVFPRTLRGSWKRLVSSEYHCFLMPAMWGGGDSGMKMKELARSEYEPASVTGGLLR